MDVSRRALYGRLTSSSLRCGIRIPRKVPSPALRTNVGSPTRVFTSGCTYTWTLEWRRGVHYHSSSPQACTRSKHPIRSQNRRCAPRWEVAHGSNTAAPVRQRPQLFRVFGHSLHLYFMRQMPTELFVQSVARCKHTARQNGESENDTDRSQDRQAQFSSSGTARNPPSSALIDSDTHASVPEASLSPLIGASALGINSNQTGFCANSGAAASTVSSGACGSQSAVAATNSETFAIQGRVSSSGAEAVKQRTEVETFREGSSDGPATANLLAQSGRAKALDDTHIRSALLSGSARDSSPVDSRVSLSPSLRSVPPLSSSLSWGSASPGVPHDSLSRPSSSPSARSPRPGSFLSSFFPSAASPPLFVSPSLSVLSPALLHSAGLTLLSSVTALTPETLRQPLAAACHAAGISTVFSPAASAGVPQQAGQPRTSLSDAVAGSFSASLLRLSEEVGKMHLSSSSFARGQDTQKESTKRRREESEQRGCFGTSPRGHGKRGEKDFHLALLELVACRLWSALEAESEPLRRALQHSVTALLVKPLEWHAFHPELYRARRKRQAQEQEERPYRQATSSPSAFQASLYVPPPVSASALASGLAPVELKARPVASSVFASEPSAADAGGKLAKGLGPLLCSTSPGETLTSGDTARLPSPLFGESLFPAEGNERILDVLSKRLAQHERLIETQMCRIQELEGQLLSLTQVRSDTQKGSDSRSAPAPVASASASGRSTSSRSPCDSSPHDSSLRSAFPSSSPYAVSPLPSSTSASRDAVASSLGEAPKAGERRETVLRERSLPSTPLWRFVAFFSILVQLMSAASVPAARNSVQRLRLWFSKKWNKGRVAADARSRQTSSAPREGPAPPAKDCCDIHGAAVVRRGTRSVMPHEKEIDGDDAQSTEGRTGEQKAGLGSPHPASVSSEGRDGEGANHDGKWRTGAQQKTSRGKEVREIPDGTADSDHPSFSRATRHGGQQQTPVGVSGVGVIDQILSDERVAALLTDRMCRMRGAALKLMQMVSMIEGSLPPVLTEALKKTRDNADIMPEKQLLQTLREELGTNWQGHFAAFSLRPFAAASIGQVHRAILRDGQEVAVKVQFPGVATSIASDLRNLKALVQWTHMLPRSLFLDVLCDEMKQELLAECDYNNELAFYRHFRELLHRDFGRAFYVPRVFPAYSTKRVLVTEFVRGLSLEQVGQQMPQQVRNSISERLVRLVLAEIFLYRLLNTDPNPSNFFYIPEADSVALIDFGAGRTYDPLFIDKYLQLLHAAVEERVEVVRRLAGELGFFGSSSSTEFLHAQGNVFLAFALCFRPPKAGESAMYSFEDSEVFSLLHKEMQKVMKNRERPPPPEIYSLHRKIAGCFLLCAKLRGRVDTSKVFAETMAAYRAPDGGPFRPAESLDFEKA
ncbi:ABC1 protein [Toxoplasma gondii VEG]|uniref:ABC1 protein n=2 Tax=Toxoplasma gondii TaxID=5811 RepID=V4YYE4_TOXGV|nr:ABC1 protein [Toxoplasma gondii VEG]